MLSPLLFAVLAAAQAPAKRSGYVPPRSADGKADLQGIWQARNTAASSLEDHGAAAGIRAGTSVIVDPKDGKIPYEPAGLKQRDENFRNRATLDPLNKCFLPGVPRVMYLDFPFQIFQTSDFVIMAFEYVHATRTIYLSKKDHPDEIDFWMGDSRGHWEGDTLVVEVADNNPQTWLDASGNFHSDALKITERFTRTSPDTLQYEATFDDPKTYTKPWKISMPLYLDRDKNAQIFEYECPVYREETADKR